MQLPAFLAIFTRYRLNGEREATRAAGRDIGRTLALDFVGGVQEGIDAVFAVSERQFLGLPDPDAVDVEFVPAKRRR